MPLIPTIPTIPTIPMMLAMPITPAISPILADLGRLMVAVKGFEPLTQRI
jgi:hypothetical protein